ncbi:tyrosine-protein phosphatase [Desulfosporosinus youngiae]|uniref:protein-tyrosine-phosphatase n=1 Tax=Desulfosporosinus youngiae DSM 17734 TaxID=768710 RepID=H5XZG6_9FIRM|nr:CpsB/CapC family capsule biosynthesis tyrosine phosphatase [Desulfosporosinus youngiae]EHQ91872.1 capsular polysaccharide biosynthesis protein [Desulfosporosinus youngiae DSM 17734]
MIDIHSHILPDLDDGSKNIEDTLEIIGQLRGAGFKTLIATPHVLEGREYLSPEEILAAVDQVRKRVTEASIPIEILPGAENYIFPDMGKWAGGGKLLTLGNTGKYLLLELPMLEIPQYTEKVFFDLQVEGLIPVLAHPERNKGLIDQPELLLEWAKKGIFFQLNLRSLRGRYGPQAQELAEIMLSGNLVHFIGSDAHRPSQKESVYLETLKNLKEVAGEEKFQEVTLKNPQAILIGEELVAEKEYTLHRRVRNKRKNGLLGFLRR